MSVTADEQLLQGLPLGEVQHSRARTITDGEFGLLTSLTWTIGPMHVDEEHMKTTPFGRRILGGPVVAAVVSGLWYTTCWEDFRRAYNIKPIAALGLEARNRGPVFPNDTIRAETTLVDARPWRDQSGRGVLVFEDRAFNQRGELVIKMRRELLFERLTPGG